MKIVGVRQCAGVEVPILLMVTQVATYGRLDGPVVSFDFSVSLGMAHRGEDVLDVQEFENVLKELRD